MIFKKFLYKSYRRFYITKRWRKTRFTKVGALIFILMGVSAVTGLDINRNAGYSIFSILFTIYFFSIIFAKFLKTDLEFERELPKYGTVDEKLNYFVKITNKQKKDKESLFYLEVSSDPRPSFDDFINKKYPDEKKHNIWDRYVMYHKWSYLLNKAKDATFEEKEFEIKKNQTKRVDFTLIPNKRGILKLNASMILQPDIFNIYRSLKYYKNKDSLIILPKRYPLKPIILNGKGKDKASEQTSNSIGNAGEFFSLRDYRRGDPLKNIHWKSWAKFGKPIVKEFQKRSFVRNALILDTFGEDGMIFEEAVSITASFVSSIKNNESILDLIFIQNKLFKITKDRKTKDDSILKVLATIKIDSEKNIFKLNLAVKKISSRTSSVILILLKLDSKRVKIINHLNLSKIKTEIFVITDTDETNIDKKLIKQFPIKLIHTDRVLKDLNSW